MMYIIYIILNYTQENQISSLFIELCIYIYMNIHEVCVYIYIYTQKVIYSLNICSI